MEEPPAGGPIVRPSSQPQLAPPCSPPVPGGGMDCPNRKQSSVSGELPEDSLAEILARVPIRCLCRSKCVAKTWRDLIEDPFHRKKLPQTLQGFFFIKHQIRGLHMDYVSMLARPPPLFQIDRSLSFLTELPGYETLTCTDSCNGLLLFEHRQESLSFDYVVWNPATKQWGDVPRYGPLSPNNMYGTEQYTYLVFDPAISSHFHLIQYLWGCKEFEGFVVDAFDDDDDDDDDHVDESVLSSVHVYSSETGRWFHRFKRWNDQGVRPSQGSCRHALQDGMLHFITSGQDQIVVVDAQGFTQDFIPVPMMMAENKSWLERGYVAQSQGRLHYIKKATDAQLSIWVLADYNRWEFVLKHSVSFMELFGKSWQCRAGHKNGYSVVGMHPDGNVVFIVQSWDLKLISYDMDHKLVSVIGTLENDTLTMDVVPYVPCFLELPALTNKH